MTDVMAADRATEITPTGRLTAQAASRGWRDTLNMALALPDKRQE